jgi:hypothetical protein
MFLSFGIYLIANVFRSNLLLCLVLLTRARFHSLQISAVYILDVFVNVVSMTT